MRRHAEQGANVERRESARIEELQVGRRKLELFVFDAAGNNRRTSLPAAVSGDPRVFELGGLVGGDFVLGVEHAVGNCAGHKALGGVLVAGEGLGDGLGVEVERAVTLDVTGQTETPDMGDVLGVEGLAGGFVLDRSADGFDVDGLGVEEDDVLGVAERIATAGEDVGIPVHQKRGDGGGDEFGAGPVQLGPAENRGRRDRFAVSFGLDF